MAIAAPSEIACAEIEAQLAADADLRVVGSCVPSALRELLGHANADVLLLDLGSETTEEFERIAEDLALPVTILLSWDGHLESHLLSLGVRAVLPQRTSAARIVAAVKAVAAGLVVLDAEFAGVELPTDAEPRGERELIEALTPRETEVLRLLAEGLPNKEIAGALGISEHTVKFHLSAIFGKLGATSRTEAVAIGIRRGLVMV